MICHTFPRTSTPSQVALSDNKDVGKGLQFYCVSAMTGPGKHGGQQPSHTWLMEVVQWLVAHDLVSRTYMWYMILSTNPIDQTNTITTFSIFDQLDG